MRDSSESAGVGIAIIIAAVWVIALVTLRLGAIQEQKQNGDWQEEAVKAGVAEWVADVNGKAKFQFKTK